MQVYEKELKVRAEEVNAILDRYAPAGECPAVLKEAMVYSLQAGGKRIRPVLLLETARLCGGRRETAEVLAAALEMIHTYSLIHDDLPAMDDDTLRRGRPTNHVVYGEGMAVLAGDGLLSYAFELMLESIPYGTDEIVPYLRAVKRIAAAAGHNGMIAGQAMDLLSEGKEPDAEVLQYIHRHKTGAILSASVLAAAIAAGADERQLDALERYAAAIGLAFQLADDVLDIRGDKGKVGKTIGKDQAAQKLTYPLVYGMDQTLAKLQELNVEAAESLASFGAEARFLIETADFICKRDY